MGAIVFAGKAIAPMGWRRSGLRPRRLLWRRGWGSRRSRAVGGVAPTYGWRGSGLHPRRLLWRRADRGGGSWDEGQEQSGASHRPTQPGFRDAGEGWAAGSVGKSEEGRVGKKWGSK